jgi:hypothetical protein
MKVAVVTTSIGANKPTQPQIVKDNIEYHAFLDEGIFCDDVPGWVKHKALNFTSSVNFKNRRNAKIYKILPFLFLPGFDFYIYIDSTHTLSKEPEEIVDRFLTKTDIAVFKHPYRGCVYEEGEEVKKINFDIGTLIDEQLNFYKQENYPRNNGLFELPARIQRNTEDTQKMCLMWWELICKYSSRDQISFPFACFKTKTHLSIMPGKANEFFGNEIMPQVVASGHTRTI